MPRIRGVYTRQNGLFLDSGTGAQKLEQYVAIQLEAIRGKWAVETWNDVGTKDRGPTFGLRIRWHQ